MPAYESWVAPAKNRSGKPSMRLFCLPYAGGDEAIFRGWQELLGADIDVRPIRLPGRGVRIREPAVVDLAGMVAALDAAIEPFSEEPFALFGHSMGALLAHELTLKRMREGARLPACLCVSARPAPHVAVPTPWHSVSAMSDAEFIELLQDISKTRTRLLDDPALCSIYLPMIKADFILCENWRPQPTTKLPVPLVAFAGTRDSSVSPEAVKAWELHCDGGFVFHAIDGDHFFVLPEAARMCRILREHFAGARQPGLLDRRSVAY